MSSNAYEVLGLNGPASSYADTDFKVAYKRALLLHHPDKSKSKSSDAVPLRSVDEISRAYKVLTDKEARAQHDRDLVVQARHKLGHGAGNGHTGLETVDLDDMDMSEESGDGPVWEKSCRCGRRYMIHESQLKQEADKGELFVPCEGCSLWLRVLFQATDET